MHGTCGECAYNFMLTLKAYDENFILPSLYIYVPKYRSKPEKTQNQLISSHITGLNDISEAEISQL